MYRLIENPDKKDDRTPHPRSNANIFKILTFSWLLNLFKIGRKRDLNESDLYTTLNDHKSSTLGDELEKKWRNEMDNAKVANRKPSLLRALVEMIWVKYMFNGLILFVNEIVFKTSQPLLIGELLTYFQPDGSNNLNYAFICSSILLVSILTSMILWHYAMVGNMHCGMQMRVACSSTIYRKALRLSHTALTEISIGRIINLLSNDINRFEVAFLHCHFLWIGPLHTIVVTYFVWQEIGISSLVGVIALLFFIPLQGWLGKNLSKLRSNTAIKTDERIQLMNEILSGIQIIKMYTWEKPFAKIIENSRIKEIQHIRGSSYIRSILASFKYIQTRFQLFTCILAYVLLGNYITIKNVYVMISFYSHLQTTMAIFFSQALGQSPQLLVSINRVQNFLLREEKYSQLPKNSKTKNGVPNGVEESLIYNENNIKNNFEVEKNNSLLHNYGIVISNATAKWINNQSVNSIENINLTVRSDRLVAIIGPVGAGKSSLIQAILQELPLSEGLISVRGVISYASQEPWLFAGSVQENIIFDSPLDNKRYKQVIQVCALKNDLKQFPYGDRTIVGERGVTLSGGQRARINLARAVYKQADLYLLDDPLSAVDTHVAQHIFEKCIKGFLKEKCCVLITHQIQYLTNVDQIVLMENSKILAEGTFLGLQNSGIDFTKLLGSSKKGKMVPIVDGTNTNRDYIHAEPILSPRGSIESISSILSVNDGVSNRKISEPNEESENFSSGHITKNVYLLYFSAGGNICKLLFFIFIYIFAQILITGLDYWITFWVQQEEIIFHYNGNNTITNNDSSNTMIMWSSYRQTYVIVYSTLIVSLIVTILISSFTFVSVFMGSSIKLHKKMFNAIIRATMLFFNTNSSGRIFNRFSKDIGAIDEVLPFIFLDCLQSSLNVFAIIIVVGWVNIYLMIPTIIIGAIFYQLKLIYWPTSRSLKRLEGVTQSPIFSHISTSIQGLTTIRAYQVEKILSKQFDKYQDIHSSVCYLIFTSSHAFGAWLDILIVFYLSIVTFTFIYIGQNISGGNVGLAITQIFSMAGIVQCAVRQWAELGYQITSVERVLEYIYSPQESNFKSPLDRTPPKEWPDLGKIVFQKFNLRYSIDTSHVLKNLNIIIRPMEKVGIVGRTGAGKSSIISALFRLAINEGNILIDDIEIHELGLQDLRSKFSIIPQEPVLFSGTMRSNLDPFNEYADHVLWNALDEVELKVLVENLPGGLNSKMSESGSNFSVGQKQLVCLARALVRNNKILVLDEATANVDLQTDALIQNTIRNKFRSCTVLTIAHRLNTVMDSDKVLVMDAGTMVEFDHPYNLLKNKDGFLFRMVEQTGRASADLLHRMAAESFMGMHEK